MSAIGTTGLRLAVQQGEKGNKHILRSIILFLRHISIHLSLFPSTSDFLKIRENSGKGREMKHSLPPRPLAHLPRWLQLNWPWNLLHNKTLIKNPIGFLCRFMVWLMKVLSAHRAGHSLIRASGMWRGPLDQRLPAH